jgi:flagellar hook-basal body complex protein FliE
MINGINHISILAGQSNIQRATPTAVDGKPFSDMLAEAVNKVSKLGQESASAQKAFAAGENVEIHDVVIAMEKFSIAMDMFMAVRNKIMDAYQEVMRMNV